MELGTKWAYLNEMVEPQNEQNSAAATKSKFKVGDWVVHNDANTYQIQEIRNNRYELVNGFGDKLSVPFSCRYSLRPWTLFDAKDGDVLISCRCIFIFNKIDNNWVKVHCFYHPDGSLIIENYGLMTLKYKDEVFPATKEQCDTLFQKLEEKGYKWDAENEEVMKLIKTDS